MSEVFSNPIVLKIHDGTPRSDVNLCPSCRNCHALTLATGQKTLRCNASRPFELRQAVVQCSLYSDRMHPTLYDMNEIAWTLMTDKGGRKLGFVAPERDGPNQPSPIGF